MTRPGAELSEALGQTRDGLIGFFGTLLPDDFTRGSQDLWSPAHHLDHLTRSNAPVARALTLPRDRLPRREAGRPSRSFLEVRALYREALGGGVTASRPYVPEPSGSREAQVADYAGTMDDLRAALAGWPEADLDALALRHPALGELSVREMIEFTLYHNEHHLQGARAHLDRTETP